MKKFFIIILIVLCSCSKKIVPIEPEIINYVNISEPFKMRILVYVPVSGDIIRHSQASICIGIKEEMDTIRVLTLWGRDTTFKKNENVMVIPSKKPDYNVEFPIFFKVEQKGEKFIIIDYDFKGIKTIFGDIKRIE